MVQEYKGEVGEITMKIEQPFHLKNLYIFMHNWLQEEGYIDLDEGKDKWEVLYLEKVGSAKEYWIEWRLQKQVEGNTYYRHRMTIKFHMIYAKKVEMMYQGHKVKLDHGELEINIHGWLETDFNDVWKKHWFLKHWRNIYDQRIFKEEFYGQHETNLYRDMYALQSLIKKYMKIRCISPAKDFLHESTQGVQRVGEKA